MKKTMTIKVDTDDDGYPQVASLSVDSFGGIVNVTKLWHNNAGVSFTEWLERELAEGHAPSPSEVAYGIRLNGPMATITLNEWPEEVDR